MSATAARAVLVSGASGFLGRALSAALEARGLRVLRLGRARPPAPDALAWDPAAGRLDLAGAPPFDAVVQLAGATLDRRWTATYRREIRESRVATTRLLAETVAAREPRPAVMISMSAIGLYGDRGEEVLDENSAPGRGFLAGVVREWEGAADPARRAGVRVVHPRAAPVLAARAGALGAMLPAFRLGLGGAIGSGRQWWSWIALEDLIAIFLRSLDDETIEGPLNAVAPAPIRQEDFARALSRALHRPAALRVPAFGLRLLFDGFADEGLLASLRVVPARLRRAGFTWRAPDLETFLAAELSRNRTRAVSGG